MDDPVRAIERPTVTALEVISTPSTELTAGQAALVSFFDADTWGRSLTACGFTAEKEAHLLAEMAEGDDDGRVRLAALKEIRRRSLENLRMAGLVTTRTATVESDGSAVVARIVAEEMQMKGAPNSAALDFVRRQREAAMPDADVIEGEFSIVRERTDETDSNEITSSTSCAAGEGCGSPGPGFTCADGPGTEPRAAEGGIVRGSGPGLGGDRAGAVPDGGSGADWPAEHPHGAFYTDDDGGAESGSSGSGSPFVAGTV